MVKVVCGVQPKDSIRAKESILMLSLNDTIDQLNMANSIHCYVMRREDVHVLIRALVIEGKMKEMRLRKTWKKQVTGERMKVGFVVG